MSIKIDEIKRNFDSNLTKYKNLGELLEKDLKELLNDNSIEYYSITHRIKTFSSFYEKIERKKYKDPFSEIEDICGLRIICYYLSDIETINKIIFNEFKVTYSEDKGKLLDPDRFGYISYHFNIILKNEWLSGRAYRNLGEIKAEIQVRTLIMDVWSSIEHKLSYKKSMHIPNDLKRQLYRIVALFELVDEEFDRIRESRRIYQNKSLTANELNIDSLQKLLESSFPTRKLGSISYLISVLDRLIKNEIKKDTIVKCINNFKSKEKEIELMYYKILIEDMGMPDDDDDDGYSKKMDAVEILEIATALFDEKYQDYIHREDEFTYYIIQKLKLK